MMAETLVVVFPILMGLCFNCGVHLRTVRPFVREFRKGRRFWAMGDNHGKRLGINMGTVLCHPQQSWADVEILTSGFGDLERTAEVLAI